MKTNTHVTLLWFIAAIILLAAAGPLPGATTWFVVILIFLVLISNWPVYSGYIQGATSALQTAGKQTNG